MRAPRPAELRKHGAAIPLDHVADLRVELRKCERRRLVRARTVRLRLAVRQLAELTLEGRRRAAVRDEDAVGVEIVEEGRRQLQNGRLGLRSSVGPGQTWTDRAATKARQPGLHCAGEDGRASQRWEGPLGAGSVHLVRAAGETWTLADSETRRAEQDGAFATLTSPSSHALALALQEAKAWTVATSYPEPRDLDSDGRLCRRLLPALPAPPRVDVDAPCCLARLARAPPRWTSRR